MQVPEHADPVYGIRVIEGLRGALPETGSSTSDVKKRNQGEDLQADRHRCLVEKVVMPGFS